MIISIIVAIGENRVIGVQNRLPWHLPDDLKRFRRITSGHPVIMGRKTFDSIGKPLPGRVNIVITRQRDLRIPDVRVATSFEDATAQCQGLPGADEVFVIGGADIYRQALPVTHRLYLTLVHAQIQGDAFFPEIPYEAYVERSREESNEGIPHAFVVLEKK